jgi:hypothetical protein
MKTGNIQSGKRKKRDSLYKGATVTIAFRVPAKSAGVIRKKIMAILRTYETGKIKRPVRKPGV